MKDTRGRRRGELSADDTGYLLTTNQPLGASAADFPAAVPVMQRTPDAVLHYDRSTLCADIAAGVRDRKVARRLMSAQSAKDHPVPGRQRLHTHHLQTLQDCSNHQCEHERLTTSAMIAAVDDELAAAYREQTQRAGELARVEAQAGATADSEVDDTARSLAEVGESPGHRLGRRHREHRASVAAARARVQAARSELERLQRRIDALHAARMSHWSVLLVRVHFVCEYYNRRANTYLRTLVRGLRQAPDPVEPIAIVRPDWAVPAGIPTAPPDPREPNAPGESVERSETHPTTEAEGALL